MGDIDIYPSPDTEIVQQASEPSYPVVNDLWLDTDEGTGVGLSSIIAYAQVTTNQTGITNTVVDLTGLSVNVTVPTGRRLKITGYIPQFSRTGGTVTFADLQIWEAGILTGTVISIPNTYGGGAVEWVGTPSAGAHTYKLRANTDSGATMTLETQSGARAAFILVEDITGTLWPAGQSFGAGMVASEQWIDFVPTLRQGGTTVTKNIAVARYIKIGRMVTVLVNLAVTGTGAASNDVVVGLPMPAVSANDGCNHGSGIIYDSSAAFVHPGIPTFLNSGSAVDVMAFWPAAVGGSPQMLGSREFTAALAVDDLIRYGVTYEAIT